MLKLPKGIKKSKNSLALPRNYWNKTKQNIYDYQIEKYKRKIGYLQKIQMVKLSKDNKIKNQKIQNLQIIKTKQKNIVIIARQFQ